MDQKIYKSPGFRNWDHDHGWNQKNAKEISLAWGGKYNIKKSNGYLLKGIRERVELITRLSKDHSIKLLCKVLKIARSTYYSVLNRKPSNREIENNLLKSRIFKIYCDNWKVYGCIKITHILRNQGNPRLSVNRVSRLMKQLDIKAVTVRKFTHYRSKPAVNSEFKNLVNQHFSAEKPDQLWLSDITYIHTVKHGWTYLAIVINAFSKAKSKRDITENMIFHSDLGLYLSLLKVGIIIQESMAVLITKHPIKISSACL